MSPCGVFSNLTSTPWQHVRSSRSCNARTEKPLEERIYKGRPKDLTESIFHGVPETRSEPCCCQHGNQSSAQATEKQGQVIIMSFRVSSLQILLVLRTLEKEYMNQGKLVLPSADYETLFCESKLAS